MYGFDKIIRIYNGSGSGVTVNSMTGFGRGKFAAGGVEATVEIKAVNHRYFEFSARLPRGCAYLEEPLKSFFHAAIARGKVEVGVTAEQSSENGTVVEIDRDFTDAYMAALAELTESYGLENDIKLSSLVSVPEIFKTRRRELSEEAVTEAVLGAAAEALEGFNAMRGTEGKRLEADIRARAELILERVALIEARSEETVKTYRERLEQRIRELLCDSTVDEQRLLTETAIFADKTAVDEETVRLRSHIGQLCSMLEANEPVGRKLDFIVQEMNREANTIGSKAQNTETAHTVVEIKAEIEKIREQLQNIE